MSPEVQTTLPQPPGPPATVDLAAPKAAAAMAKVRRTLATFGDQSIALRRATDAADGTMRILGSAEHAMASALGLAGRPIAGAARLPEDRPVWILGDLRGDALALAAALAFIDEADGGKDHGFVAVLGDWCGGTAGDAATTSMLLERFNAAPDRTLLLCGDREWLLAAGDDAGLPVTPSGRDMPVPAEHRQLKRAWLDALAELVPNLPVAALLPDGTLLAHGAVPRPSRLATVADWASLQSSVAALRDFAFGRLHARDDRVDAGDREGGVVAGAADFRASMAQLSRMAERPLNRLVRGQDAAPEGHRWFRTYGEGSVLTLTTMADRLGEGAARRRPCVARLKGGRLRVVQLEIPEDVARLAEQLFPPTAAAEATTPARPVTRETVTPTAVESIASTRREPVALAAVFERGVRLLKSRAWPGARDAFREASAMASLRDACLMNQAVACLWLGASGHQDALACLRQLRQAHPRRAEVHFNLGIAFLCGERNPSEAVRSLRAAVEIDPDFAEAWWALGLAAAMRHDAAGAASAFARAADGGCELPAPGSLHGGIPARELAPALDALRALARCHASAEAPSAPLQA